MTSSLVNVAKKIGVSPATVSRAINNKPGVSAKTRQTVLETIKQLGIQLTSNTTGCRLVALVTPDLSNPIFPTFVTRITTLLAQEQELPVLCVYTLGGQTEETYLKMITQFPLDGVIFLAGHYDNARMDHTIYQPLVDRNIPLAFLNASSHDQPGFYAETNDSQATEMALKHLCDLGHRKIGLLMGDRAHYPTMTKYHSALAYFKKEGIVHPSSLTQWTTYGIGSGQLAAQELIANGATAILCANDQLAIGALHAAHAMGRSVPQDLSVIGYDDSPLLTDVTPALTTVRQPVSILSQALVHGLRLLRERMPSGNRKDVVTYTPELIVRESTGPAPRSQKQ
jgi:DNA-binding LacI/PurR family transcriptional regulator